MSDLKDLAKHFGITEKELKAYIREFHAIDTNKDEKIGSEDLRKAFNSLGHVVSSEQAAEMVRIVDKNHDGMIDLEEFLYTVSNMIKRKQPSPEEEAIEAFKVFDTNNDGYVNHIELRSTMAKLGLTLSEKETSQMMKMFDKNRDGKLDCKEFLEVWKFFLAQNK